MKRLQDFTVLENRRLNYNYSLLILATTDGSLLPKCRPGQFVQVATDTKGVMLRRPISINKIGNDNRSLWLLVRRAGKGTAWLTELAEGAIINLLLPLGNGFSIPEPGTEGRLLLVGGGVGIAPLLQLGITLRKAGFAPEFLIGARSKADLLELDLLSEVGTVHCSTDDGSYGTPGVVTLNPALAEPISRIYCCGPAPMMKAVVRLAAEREIDCEVSLENMMACGLGACLCCVEGTVKGNVCVCTEGPVFNTKMLTW